MRRPRREPKVACFDLLKMVGCALTQLERKSSPQVGSILHRLTCTADYHLTTVPVVFRKCILHRLTCTADYHLTTVSVAEMYLASSNHCNQYCGFVSSKQVFLAMCIIYLVLWVVILHLLLVLCNLYLALSNHCRGLVSCSII